MTPYQLHILLHYYACTDDVREDTPEMKRNAPIFPETMAWFQREGFLVESERDDVLWEATDRTRCYVAAIMDLPLPVWTVPSST